MNQVILEVTAIDPNGYRAIPATIHLDISEPLDKDQRLLLENRIHELEMDLRQRVEDDRLARDEGRWRHRPWWRKALGLAPRQK